MMKHELEQNSKYSLGKLMATFSPRLSLIFLVRVAKRGWSRKMASSGKKRECEAPLLGFGLYNGQVKSGHPNLKNKQEYTILEYFKVINYDYSKMRIQNFYLWERISIEIKLDRKKNKFPRDRKSILYFLNFHYLL